MKKIQTSSLFLLLIFLLFQGVFTSCSSTKMATHESANNELAVENSIPAPVSPEKLHQEQSLIVQEEIQPPTVSPSERAFNNHQEVEKPNIVYREPYKTEAREKSEVRKAIDKVFKKRHSSQAIAEEKEDFSIISMISFILGVLSFFLMFTPVVILGVAGLMFAVAAIVTGAIGLGETEKSGTGFAIAGLVIGIIVLTLFLLILLIFMSFY